MRSDLPPYLRESRPSFWGKGVVADELFAGCLAGGEQLCQLPADFFVLINAPGVAGRLFFSCGRKTARDAGLAEGLSVGGPAPAPELGARSNRLGLRQFVADRVEFLMAVTEKLLEEFRGKAEVRPLAHAEFERRGQRFAGLGAKGLEHLDRVPFVDVHFVHRNAERANALVYLVPDHRPDPGRAPAIHGERELGPTDEGKNSVRLRGQEQGAHTSDSRFSIVD